MSDTDPRPADPSSPAPSLAERAMATEDAKAAYDKARARRDASDQQAAADQQAANEAKATLRQCIAELVTAAKAEDA